MSSKLVNIHGKRIEDEDVLLGVIEVRTKGMFVKVPGVAPKDLIRGLLSLCSVLMDNCLDNKPVPLVQPVKADVLDKLDN
jgi:hypothetical protein